MKRETEYKIAFRKAFAWSSSVEPAPGGDMGAADLLVLVNNQIIPIELKEGEIKEGRIYLKKPGLRPAQGIWHRQLLLAGGMSFLAIGIKRKDTWMTRLVRVDENILDWRLGWEYTGNLLTSELVVEVLEFCTEAKCL